MGGADDIDGAADRRDASRRSRVSPSWAPRWARRDPRRCSACSSSCITVGLLSFRSYPSNSGPWWVGWLLYGHLAVVVFIVLSGFFIGCRTSSVELATRQHDSSPPRRANPAALLGGVDGQPCGRLDLGAAAWRGRAHRQVGAALWTASPGCIRLASPNGVFWSIAIKPSSTWSSRCSYCCVAGWALPRSAAW